MTKKNFTDIVDIPMEYRPVPFWSWNGKLEIPVLREQIREMYEAGIGGFFMHARSGLQTEYFSDEWFEAVKACIDEARKLGMKAWLYDEDGWPSGFGCGVVNGKGVEFQQKYLRMTHGKLPKEGTLIGKSGDCTFYFEVNPYYVDLMDPKVTREFLKCVHEKYLEKLPKDMWENVQGFFTDEPQLGRFEVPWSLTLPDEYKKAYKRDIVEDLQALFEDAPDARAKRVRFWSLVTRLFSKNYMGQLQEWCHAHGVRLTGHHMLEETYFTQLCASGAVMPNYQYYDIPGVDKLGRTEPAPLAQLQLLSAAAQTGRKRMMTETFACCGWNISFQDMKWLYQLQMVRGCNFLCQHLESYTLAGVRKRDYPASLFRHQPWWPDYRAYNDYISRVGYMLGEGKICCEVLVLHGQSTQWCEYTYRMEKDECKRGGDGSKYCDCLNKLIDELEKRQVNFHLGDETLIAQHGKVADGKFIIGQQSYSVVLVPKLTNISAVELKLLLQFVKSGGIACYVKNPQGEEITVDGEADEKEVLDLKSRCFSAKTEEEAARGLTEGRGWLRFPACIVQAREGQENLLATRRHFDNWRGEPADFIYIVNRSRDKSVTPTIVASGEEILARLDATTGKFEPYPSGTMHLAHTFGPGADLMLMVRPPRPLAIKPKSLGFKYDLEVKGLNTLTLDTCRCYVDGKLAYKNLPTISLMTELLDLERAADVRIEFDFEIDQEFDCHEPLYLLCETPKQFTFELNGKQFKAKDDGYMFDQAFRRLPLPSCRPGKNTLALSTRFVQSKKVYEMLRKGRVCESEGNKITFDMELESVYLAGRFGVRGEMPGKKLPRAAERVKPGFVITALPTKADCRNLQDCGLPFFAGSVALRSQFKLNGTENYQILTINGLHANVARVRLNGVDLGTLVWWPYELDIPAGLLKAGLNTIEIELVGNLRNLLGPHHLEEGESYGVGPVSFFCRRHYLNHVPPPWNDDYCFVRFGFDKIVLDWKTVQATQ